MEYRALRGRRVPRNPPKAASFLGLPEEIRQIIYGYVFTQHTKLRIGVMYPGRAVFDGGGRALTTTSSSIRAETFSLFWSDLELVIASNSSVKHIPDWAWAAIRKYAGSIESSSFSDQYDFGWSDFSTFRRLHSLRLGMRTTNSSWKQLGLGSKMYVGNYELKMHLLHRQHRCFGLGERIVSIEIRSSEARGILRMPKSSYPMVWSFQWGLGIHAHVLQIANVEFETLE